MIYTASIKTNANTAEDSPKETRIEITNGIITKVSILFPTGCKQFVKARFFLGGHQFIPSTENQVITGNGVLIESPEFLEITNAPRIIRIITSNTDDTYDHTIEIIIAQLPLAALERVGIIDGLLGSLKNLFIRQADER